MLRLARSVRSAMLVVLSACGAQVTDTDAAIGVDGLPIVPDRTPYEPGWRWESSLGIELAVPNEWHVNDTDCHQTDAPSVVRAQGGTLSCLTPEPPTKQIVEITPTRWAWVEDPAPPQEIPKLEAVIDDEPVERIEVRLPDGRAAGWLTFTARETLVRARVRDEALLHRIFESVRVVAVDTNGCASARKSMKLKPPRTNTLLPSDATEVSICHFDQEQVLQTSARIEGADATQLVALLNSAGSGENPDVPADLCLEDKPQLADTVLIARSGTDGAAVELWFSGCKHRGLSNGRTTSRLTIPMLHAIMKPLHTGYGYGPQGLE